MTDPNAAIRKIVHFSHEAGAMDVLRAILDEADQLDPGHDCMGLALARRLFRDPDALNGFLNAARDRREQG